MASFVDVFLMGRPSEPYTHVDVDDCESQVGVMGRPSEPFKTPILPKCDHPLSQPPVIFLKGRSSEPYSHVDVELKETARTGAPVRETRLYDPGIAKVEPPRGTPPVEEVACGIPPARR